MSKKLVHCFCYPIFCFSWCGSACDKAAGSKLDTCLICMYCSKTLPEAWWSNYLKWSADSTFYFMALYYLVKAVSVQRDTDVGTFSSVSAWKRSSFFFFLMQNCKWLKQDKKWSVNYPWGKGEDKMRHPAKSRTHCTLPTFIIDLLLMWAFYSFIGESLVSSAQFCRWLETQ